MVVLGLTATTQQVTVKPFIHTAGFYIDIFSPFGIFASMWLVRLEPVRQRYVASREANGFAD